MGGNPNHLSHKTTAVWKPAIFRTGRRSNHSSVARRSVRVDVFLHPHCPESDAGECPSQGGFLAGLKITIKIRPEDWRINDKVLPF